MLRCGLSFLSERCWYSFIGKIVICFFKGELDSNLVEVYEKRSSVLYLCSPDETEICLYINSFFSISVFSSIPLNLFEYLQVQYRKYMYKLKICNNWAELNVYQCRWWRVFHPTLSDIFRLIFVRRILVIRLYFLYSTQSNVHRSYFIRSTRFGGLTTINGSSRTSPSFEG